MLTHGKNLTPDPASDLRHVEFAAYHAGVASMAQLFGACMAPRGEAGSDPVDRGEGSVVVFSRRIDAVVGI